MIAKNSHRTAEAVKRRWRKKMIHLNAHVFSWNTRVALLKRCLCWGTCRKRGIYFSEPKFCWRSSTREIFMSFAELPLLVITCTQRNSGENQCLLCECVELLLLRSAITLVFIKRAHPKNQLKHNFPILYVFRWKFQSQSSAPTRLCGYRNKRQPARAAPVSL